MIIQDYALGNLRSITFRFSQAEKFHEEMTKQLKKNAEYLPDFPKKNSVGFWNRTNSDHKKIESRQR